MIDRMEGNEEIFGKLMADGEFWKLAVEHLLHKVYGVLQRAESSEVGKGKATGRQGAAMQAKAGRASSSMRSAGAEA